MRPPRRNQLAARSPETRSAQPAYALACQTLLLFGSHYRYYQGTRLKILPGDALHLVQRDGFIQRVFGVRVRVSEAVEFVESVGHGEAAEVLACDLPLPNDLGLGAFEFFGGEPFGTQQFGLVQQLGFRSEEHT